MAGIKNELAEMLNRALELEQAARIQYLTHAEQIQGLSAEPIILRLREIAEDEEKHEKKFRTLISDYLGITPTMSIGKTHKAEDIITIIETNQKNEKEAIDLYKTIYNSVVENKKNLHYEFETLEHEIRHIIMDEQEHIAELSILLR